jgi:hypothetical protein
MKHTEENKIDKLFHDAFENFEAEPSNAVWMGIEKELDRDGYYHRRVLYIRYAAAASVLIGLFFGIYYLSSDVAAPQVARKVESTAPAAASSAEQTVLKKNTERVQPTDTDLRLADVVEIKTRGGSAGNKPANANKTVRKPVAAPDKQERAGNESGAIDLLKINEDKREKIKVADVEIQKIKAIEPKPTSLASAAPAKIPAPATESKKEISNMVDVVNYLAEKVSGDDKGKLIAVNDTKSGEGASRKSYQIDLGIVKLTRVKHTN